MNYLQMKYSLKIKFKCQIKCINRYNFDVIQVHKMQFLLFTPQ
jgi:hypothetical protein